MLGGESRELASGRLRDAWWSRAALADTARAHSAVVAGGALIVPQPSSRPSSARSSSGRVHGPFVFPDELGYERMAHSLAARAIALFGKAGLSYSPLYPVFLSPIYALTSSAQVAYEWAKVENAVLMSLSVFPVYGIARFVLPRSRVARASLRLAVLAPLMFYTASR